MMNVIRRFPVFVFESNHDSGSFYPSPYDHMMFAQIAFHERIDIIIFRIVVPYFAELRQF